MPKPRYNIVQFQNTEDNKDPTRFLRERRGKKVIYQGLETRMSSDLSKGTLVARKQ